MYLTYKTLHTLLKCQHSRQFHPLRTLSERPKNILDDRISYLRGYFSFPKYDICIKMSFAVYLGGLQKSYLKVENFLTYI